MCRPLWPDLAALGGLFCVAFWADGTHPGRVPSGTPVVVGGGVELAERAVGGATAVGAGGVLARL